jgi:hypothetical protein
MNEVGAWSIIIITADVEYSTKPTSYASQPRAPYSCIWIWNMYLIRMLSQGILGNGWIFRFRLDQHKYDIRCLHMSATLQGEITNRFCAYLLRTGLISWGNSLGKRWASESSLTDLTTEARPFLMNTCDQHSSSSEETWWDNREKLMLRKLCYWSYNIEIINHQQLQNVPCFFFRQVIDGNQFQDLFIYWIY